MDINLNSIIGILPDVFKIIQNGAKEDCSGNQSLYLDLERSILESALECFESTTKREGECSGDVGEAFTPKQNHNDVIITEASEDDYKKIEMSEMDMRVILDNYLKLLDDPVLFSILRINKLGDKCGS